MVLVLWHFTGRHAIATHHLVVRRLATVDVWVAVALLDVFVRINLRYMPFALLWGTAGSNRSGYFLNRDKKWWVLRHSHLLLVKDNWNILLILFVWYMKAEPEKKTHLEIYPAYFYILLPHYKSPSFITYTHPLWSYFFCLS